MDLSELRFSINCYAGDVDSLVSFLECHKSNGKGHLSSISLNAVLLTVTIREISQPNMERFSHPPIQWMNTS